MHSDAESPSIWYKRAGMARINLIPQNRIFFDLYGHASRNVVAIAQTLVKLLDEFPAGSDAAFREIRELEHEGDRVTHDVVDNLNRTFVTPFDRDDMYRLAGALDDICDHVDEAAGNILGYGVTEIRDLAKQQAAVIERAATKLRDAVSRLEGFKDSKRELIELRELEDEGDRLNREGIAQLFASDEDAVGIIRWKDIHEQLEEAVDACENAADVLEAILVKNR
jgi:predicted phosphate transport protein (TIGR00153 family)